MVRITVDFSTSECLGMNGTKKYEKIWVCPGCGRTFETHYGLRFACFKCKTLFPDVYSLRDDQWKRVLWHISGDKHKRDFYSKDSQYWGQEFNG